jgi:periplasmic protein TonB
VKAFAAAIALGVTASTGAAQMSSPNEQQHRALEIARSMNQQITPHWHAPRGPDSEKLVTVLSWEMHQDGSLVDPPQVVRQEGKNTLNHGLAQQHATNAIQAVTRAAPFRLPPEDYELWKRVSHMRFD